MKCSKYGVLYAIAGLQTALADKLGAQVLAGEGLFARFANSTTGSQLATTQTAVPSVTLNALSATFQWWYNRTVFETVSIVSLLYNTDDNYIGWTVVGTTVEPFTSFNVSSAITTRSCPKTPQTGIDNEGVTFYWTSCGYPPQHIAASTTGVFVDAYQQPYKLSGTSGERLPAVSAPTPKAELVVPGGGPTYARGVPIVYFPAYEVVSTACGTNQRPPEGCTAVTKTNRLPTPYVFQYTGPNPAAAKHPTAVVTGHLPAAFPAYVQQSDAAAGIWEAEPTVVLYVVRVIVAVAVLAAHVEKSASVLAVPTQYDRPATRPVTAALQTTARLEHDTQVGKPIRSEMPTKAPEQAKQTDKLADWIATAFGIPKVSPAQTTTQTQPPGRNTASQPSPSGTTGSRTAYTGHAAYTYGASIFTTIFCVALALIATAGG